jgi:uncharacterized protein
MLTASSFAVREEVSMATAIDPVCHMEVDVDDPPGGTFEHDGTTYFFCSAGCREAFAAGPASHLERS